MFKNLDLRKLLNIIYISLMVLGGLFILDMLVFLPVYFATSNEIVLLVGTIIGFGLMALMTGGVLVSGNVMYRVFYNGLLYTTRENLDRFINRKGNFVKFENKFNVKEFSAMNEKLDSLELTLKNTTIIALHDDYAHIGLQFFDSYNQIATYESFTKNIKKLIFTAKSYRNAFIQLDYDIQDNELSKENYENVIKAIKQNFDYYKTLISVSEDKKRFLVFIPAVESISRLKEEVDNFLNESSVMNQSNDGLVLTMSKVSVVIYPFSDIDEILSDLRYASRQGKRVFFYLPNKLFMRRNENLNDLSLNVNTVSKALSMLSSLRIRESIEQDRKIIKEALTHLIGYLNIDEAGVIYYNSDTDRYRPTIVAHIGSERIFEVNKQVSASFVSEFKNVIDEDGSYYFSSRKHANRGIGKFADIYGFESGYFYTIESRQRTFGVIYFINKRNSMILDTYNKEALLMISNAIYNSSQYRQYNDDVAALNRRFENISKLSNLRVYTINRNTYELTSFSATMKDRNPNVEVGKRCFECLYNRDAPCKDCPLLTGKKRILKEGSTTYETSLTLDDPNSVDANFLISLPNDTLSDHNRFDSDFLVNSYYSLVDRLKNLYLINSKGYLITLKVDNQRKLIQDLGNEKYNSLIRKFTGDVADKVKNIARVYHFNDNIFACVLPEMGRVDISDAVEAIYKLSKNITRGVVSEDSLEICYEAIRYPQTFDNEMDLMAYVDKYLITEAKHPVDTLHFEENDYIRPASRDGFILETIDNAVKNNTFIMRMQPVVKADNRTISGAEILIRLNDENRNLLFNTFEMIKVAGNNNKIGIISDILINYIGDVYNKFGYTVFKASGFNRISLNTEFSYFSDPNFLPKIEAMMKKYYFPKEFLGFEINERDLFDNIETFKPLARSILSNHVALICDQYTGQYLSVDALKNLGISEIKIARNIVKNIDTNADNLKEVLSIIDLAKSSKMKATLVGVENVDQYNLIKQEENENKEIYMQGYYFYQPLENNELIEALRKANK